MTSSTPVRLDLFPEDLPQDLVTLSRLFQEAGYQLYLVGGAVRDLLLSFGKAPLKENDFDFSTNATPEEVQKILTLKGKTRVFSVPTGLKHGTVTAVFETGDETRHYEITTFRIDGHYLDGRHPQQVQYTSSLTEDLSRRDFTINAIAYDLLSREIHDPFGGLTDLKNGIIRTVGNPIDRFSEDGLRPVRACRIASQVSFRIDEDTFRAIPMVLDKVRMVSLERIHDELIKLLKTEKPSVGLEYLRESGLLDLFIPELLEGYQFNQNEFHKFDVYYHNLYSCDAAPREFPLIRLAALLHDIGKPRSQNFAVSHGNGNVFYNHEIIGERLAEKFLKRLKFSNTDREYVKKLVKLHMFYYTEDWTDGAVRRFLRKMDGDRQFLQDLFLLRRADRIGSGMKGGDADILKRFRERIDVIFAQDSALKVTDLMINGNDIMQEFSIPPSRLIGMMLNEMLEKVLDEPELNNRESLIEIGRRFIERGCVPEHPAEPEIPTEE